MVTNKTRLFCEDALVTLSKMKNESVDLIITDPPYRTIGGGRKGKRNQPTGMLTRSDGKLFNHNDTDPAAWFPELYRVLKPNSHCYVMVNHVNLEKYLTLAREARFLLHNVLIWKKNNVTPNQWYMKNAEFILFLRKGSAKPINNVGTKSVIEVDNVKHKTHPTEKPVRLIEILMFNSSSFGDVVFDPFMGTGSTGVVAKKHGRKFLGVEIDRDYFDIALKRISEVGIDGGEK